MTRNALLTDIGLAMLAAIIVLIITPGVAVAGDDRDPRTGGLRSRPRTRPAEAGPASDTHAASEETHVIARPAPPPGRRPACGPQRPIYRATTVKKSRL